MNIRMYVKWTVIYMCNSLYNLYKSILIKYVVIIFQDHRIYFISSTPSNYLYIYFIIIIKLGIIHD